MSGIKYKIPEKYFRGLDAGFGVWGRGWEAIVKTSILNY
jgi:hypothetical protein